METEIRGNNIVVRRKELASGNGKSEQGAINKEIYLSKDYDRFEFYTQNRVPKKQHVEKMKKSLGAFGFLAEHPITVIEDGNKLKITDGQHRFLAARDLEMPVYYAISRSSDVQRDIIVEHLYSKAWDFDDFLHHYVSIGMPEYKLFSEFRHKHQIPIRIAIFLLQSRMSESTTDKMLTHGFKNGEFKTDPVRLEVAEEVMKQVNEIRFFHSNLSKFKDDRTFIKSLIIMVQTQGYDHGQMLKNTERNVMSFVKCTNTEDYLRMLGNIYNFHKREENYLIFKK